jgi:hypothetical protein
MEVVPKFFKALIIPNQGDDPMSNEAEIRRLVEDEQRGANWKRWGPYLSERQWGTVREDYSADNGNWTSFTYEDSLPRAYRWGRGRIARHH